MIKKDKMNKTLFVR